MVGNRERKMKTGRAGTVKKLELLLPGWDGTGRLA